MHYQQLMNHNRTHLDVIPKTQRLVRLNSPKYDAFKVQVLPPHLEHSDIAWVGLAGWALGSRKDENVQPSSSGMQILMYFPITETRGLVAQFPFEALTRVV